MDYVCVFGAGMLVGGWCVYVVNKGKNPVKIIIDLIVVIVNKCRNGSTTKT